MISRILKSLTLAIGLSAIGASAAQAICNKRFLNPITEVCWDCIFPISIGAISLFGSRPDTKNQSLPICLCPGIPPRLGLSIGLWEPARLIDVANEPGCFVNMGFDMDFGLFGTGQSTKRGGASDPGGSSWQAHYYYYPLISWLGTIVDGLCMQNTTFDVAYVSEFDPLWQDGELNTLINPEAILFANPIAQGACAADCVRASSGRIGFNSMFWCDGCNGPMYPISGEANSHVGGIQASRNVASKLQARMHRYLLARQTGHSSALCQTRSAPIIQRQYYRQQLTRPSATTSGRYACAPMGSSSQFIDRFRERPFVAESFGWLHWRKRNCCAL